MTRGFSVALGIGIFAALAIGNPSSSFGYFWDREIPQLILGQAPASTLASIPEGETALRDACRQAILDEYKDRAQARSESRAIRDAANRMGRVAFVVTHLLLFLAVAAAVYEFVAAARTRRFTATQTELQMSLHGIALKSSALGTVLLVVSLAFYYVVLKFVMPVSLVR